MVQSVLVPGGLCHDVPRRIADPMVPMMETQCAGCGADLASKGWYLHVADIGKVCDTICWEKAKLNPPQEKPKPEGWVWPWNN